VLAGLAPRGFCNPAVALAASLRGMLSVRLLLALWFAQAVAAVAAGRLAAWVFTSQEAPPLVPREGSAFWVEFIFGAGLCAVVLARSHRHPREAGLAGGLFLAGVGSAVAGISGAIFNPAAAWTMISSSLLDSGSFWIYGFAGVAAACASAAAALVVRPHNPGSQKSANLPHASKAKPPTREKTPHISQ
jgi:aquaporin Z